MTTGELFEAFWLAVFGPWSRARDDDDPAPGGLPSSTASCECHTVANVRLDIDGVSRPTQPLTQLVPPLADHLQDRGVRRYLAAMRTLTRD
jgi:hypothetical protein